MTEKTTVKCNCENDYCNCSTQKQTFILGAKAHFVGTVCDTCANSCVRDYITHMLGMQMAEVLDFPYHPHVTIVANAVNVENASTGEVLAKFYGPYRWEHARHMLRFVG